jgi:hypothetical protein
MQSYWLKKINNKLSVFLVIICFLLFYIFVAIMVSSMRISNHEEEESRFYDRVEQILEKKDVR